MKRIYISSDYSENNGDREVVNELQKWGSDKLHKVEFIDMAKVASGSVSKNNPDCRPCDLKKEFNRQINASSAVIIVIGDKTAARTAGSQCSRQDYNYFYCQCTPYKQNANGHRPCKVLSYPISGKSDDVCEINKYSYLRHEFEQAKKGNRTIIVVYNSLRKHPSWLPDYMKDYENVAQPFWVKNAYGENTGNYAYIKEALGYD